MEVENHGMISSSVVSPLPQLLISPSIQAFKRTGLIKEDLVTSSSSHSVSNAEFSSLLHFFSACFGETWLQTGLDWGEM